MLKSHMPRPCRHRCLERARLGQLYRSIVALVGTLIAHLITTLLALLALLAPQARLQPCYSSCKSAKGYNWSLAGS